MQKNWSAIAALDDPYVRVSLVMARKLEVLVQLRGRFPKCFTDASSDGIVPDSLQKDVTRIIRPRNGERSEDYERRIVQYFEPLGECREAVAA